MKITESMKAPACILYMYMLVKSPGIEGSIAMLHPAPETGCLESVCHPAA